MRLLITGGAGFIGSNFVHYILQKRSDWQLTVIDALTYAGNLENLAPVKNRVRFVHGNINNETLLEELVVDTDIVVHFAADSHNDNSIENPAPFMENNLLGTFHVLEAVRKHKKRLHHISTDEVFGDLPLNKPELKFTLETPYNPSSPYSASKAGSDHLVRAWIRTFGIEATVSNCANNYGPYQHIEKLIPRQITNILNGTKPKVYGTGQAVREWTHVDDHNEAVLQILEKGRLGETYFIGSGDEKNTLETIGLILKLMGKPEDFIEHVKDRPGHDMRYAMDSSKIRMELGWEPRFPTLEDGLKQTIDWYTENTGWWQHQKEQVENNYAKKGH